MMSVIRCNSFKSYDSMPEENEIESLKTELENEKIHRDNALWKNNDIEKSIVTLQEQLRQDDYYWENDDELQNILKKNTSLVNEIQTLKDQLPELKERLKSAKVCGKECRMKHDNLNINLDLLTEAELIKTTKRLERMKVDLKSAFISKEWSLDSESKVYQRLLDQKIHLQNQLYHNIPMGLQKTSSNHWQNGNNSKPLKPIDSNKKIIKKSIILDKLPPILK